ncbi:MAG: hypothetical protein R3301_10165 [Saprospiraceae bacterium]|nr:hypothetical protein [Saprospiraceae bacterium]
MDEHTTEKIEAYLTGTLSHADRAAFEKDLSGDADLARAFTEHTKAHAVINHGVRQRWKARLQEIDAELDAPAHTRRVVPLWRKWAVAASILLVAGAGLWFWADYAYADRTIATSMLAVTEADAFRGEGATLEQRHVAAETLFMQGEITAARDAFLTLAAEDNALSPRADWNLLMTYLVLGDQPSFDALLRSLIADTRHVYHQRAVRLQKTLQHPLYRLTH